MLQILAQVFNFFYSITAEPIFRRIFTPDNARRTLYVLITMVITFFLYIFAIVLYSIIYFNFIPQSSVSVPLFFDYSWFANDPYHSPLFSDNVIVNNGDGNSKDLLVSQPGPFAAIDLSSTFLPLMKSSVNYKLSISLDLPKNPHNQELGNFMVRLAVTPNIHEFVKVHHHSQDFRKSPGFFPSKSSSKQHFFERSGLNSRFPLTHFPETYIMDLPHLYTKGPHAFNSQSPDSSGCACKQCSCKKCACNAAKTEQASVNKSGESFNSHNTVAEKRSGGCGCSKTKRVSEKISVLSTRPAILSYKPILLEYLEMLFWSPLYVLGFFQSGFSETIVVDMVENWTKKSALLGTSATYPSQSALSQLFISSDPLGSFLESISSASTAFFVGIKRAFGKLQYIVNPSIESSETEQAKMLNQTKVIKENEHQSESHATEVHVNPFELTEDFLANPEGHVWVVVELDRIAHLNNAKLTLHTQWQGLRFWMHKYRFLLFILGPFFIWALECLGAVAAGFMIVSFFENPASLQLKQRTSSNRLDSNYNLRNSNGNNLANAVGPSRNTRSSSSQNNALESHGNTNNARVKQLPSPASPDTSIIGAASSDDKGKRTKMPSNSSSKASNKDNSSSTPEPIIKIEKHVLPITQSSSSRSAKAGSSPAVNSNKLFSDSPTQQSTDSESNQSISPKKEVLSKTSDNQESQDSSRYEDTTSTDTESVFEDSMPSFLSHQDVLPASVTHATAQGSNSQNDKSSRSSSISSLRRTNTESRGSLRGSKKKPVTLDSLMVSSSNNVGGLASPQVSQINASALPSPSDFRSRRVSIHSTASTGSYSFESNASYTGIQSSSNASSTGLNNGARHTTMQNETHSHDSSSISFTNSNTSVMSEEGDSLQGQTAVASGGLNDEDSKRLLG